MKTLNEQMDRLRNVLVTCYKAIKRKGGTIPEEGERNMTNLPAAVASIPQIHGVLTELTVTADGEYLPADHNANGFSKVTAKFDTSSLPKVKLPSLKVTDNLLDENGYWAAELVDTSLMTSMNQVFANATNLKTIDVSDWDTSNITNMGMLFYNCNSLEVLDLSKWDVSKVTIMMRMFEECSNLKEIRLDYWESLSIEDIIYMFYKCTSLQSLDVNHLNVKGVSSMYNVFSGCESLESLNLNNWDVSNVTSMDSMFRDCKSLQSLNISNWDTHICASMLLMFINCNSLTELDLSSWDTSNVTNMQQMFSGCYNLKKLDISNWDAGNVTLCIYMFDNCRSLETLVGGKTIEEVGNDVSCLRGLEIGLNLSLNNTILDTASLRALINGLADLTGQTPQTLTLGATLMAKLETEDPDSITIATEKGWNLA